METSTADRDPLTELLRRLELPAQDLISLDSTLTEMSTARTVKASTSPLQVKVRSEKRLRDLPQRHY